MSLLTKLFGTRPKTEAPHYQVYLYPGDSRPLRGALDEVATTLDTELLIAWTTHYSGYIRETAIARCVELGRAECLSCIADRLNDWVPEVRRAAANGMLTLLSALPVEHFAPLLPRLRTLTQARRTDHAAWLLLFEQELIKAGGKASIVDALRGPDFRLRRSAYAVCVAHGLLEPTELVTQGLRSGDVLMARQAVELIEAFSPEVQLDYLQLAGASNFAVIRMAVLRATLKLPLTPLLEDFIHNALFDSQGSIRGAARAWLVNKGVDVSRICADALASGRLSAKQVRAALSSLAEAGGAGAASTIRFYSKDLRIDVRARALLLWSRLEPSSRDGIADQALNDPSPKVRAVGTLVCVQQGAYVPLRRVDILLRAHGDYRCALRICRREKWDHLACLGLVAELINLDEATRSELRQILEVWLRQEGSSWTKPTNEHTALLSRRETMAALKGLAACREAQLEHRLKEYGIWI